jgi:uncharacterized protein (DUF362 family)
MAKVAIAKGDDAVGTARKAMALLGGMKRFVRRKDGVFIKPNLMAPFFTSMVSPEVLRAVVEMCFEAGASEVVVAENPMCRVSGAEVFYSTGIAEYLESFGAAAVRLDKAPYKEVEVRRARVFKRIKLPLALLSADKYISVPKMKTHALTGVTLGIKNAHGLLLEEQKAMHHGAELAQKLVDINKARPPDLAVLDATHAMDGAGPLFGDNVDMRLVLASADVVALDAVAASVMGIAPLSIETTRLAHEQGLGSAKAATAGESIANVRRKFTPGYLKIPKRIGGARFVAQRECPACANMLKLGLSLFFKYPRAFPEEFSRVRNVTVCYGESGTVADDTVILFGDQAMRSSVKARRIIKIPGCPPTDWIALMEALTREFDLRVLGYFVDCLRKGYYE